jgi:hypothetical protein
VLESLKRPSPLASTNRTWSRGNGPAIVVVVAASVVVGASVVGVVVASIEVDVAAAVIVVVAMVVVVTGVVVMVEMTSDVELATIGTVMLGSSTNGSAGSGRPAIATPASPPTTTTAKANGHDLRMRCAKVPAHSRPRPGGSEVFTASSLRRS